MKQRSSVKFSIVVLSNRALGYIVIDKPVNSVATTLLPLSTWTPLFVGYVLRADLKTIRIIIYQGAQFSNMKYPSSTTNPIPFLNTDLVIVGGPSTFIGEVASVRLFSPGTPTFRSKFNKTGLL